LETIYLIFAGLINGYIYSTLLYLLFSLSSFRFQNGLSKYLNSANLLILFILSLNLVLEIKGFLKCNEIEEMIKRHENIGNYFIRTSECATLLRRTLILGFLFHILFVLKKVRVSVWATLISLVSLSVLVNFEMLYIFVSNLFRDYLPYSWSTNYKINNLAINCISTFAFMGICILISGALSNEK